MLHAQRWRSRARIGLVALGASLVAAVGSTQPQNFLRNFTGQITIGNSEEMRTSRIRFEAGARTNWHLHSEGQILLIEEGTGRWQEQGGEVKILRRGEPAYTTPNVSHWHGASPEEAALQFSVYAGTLEWQDPVTDDQYLGR